MAKIPNCWLAQDGFFALDHIPVVVDTRLLASRYKTKITRLVRNATLKFSDKGACRRYVNRIQRQSDLLFNDSYPPPLLSTLTKK